MIQGDHIMQFQFPGDEHVSLCLNLLLRLAGQSVLFIFLLRWLSQAIKNKCEGNVWLNRGIGFLCALGFASWEALTLSNYFPELLPMAVSAVLLGFMALNLTILFKLIKRIP
jgi:hypothetical protein